MDGGAWRAAARGVAQSWVQVRRLGTWAYAHVCVFVVHPKGTLRVLPSSARVVRDTAGGLSTTRAMWAAGMQRRCGKVVPWAGAACPEVPGGTGWGGLRRWEESGEPECSHTGGGSGQGARHCWPEEGLASRRPWGAAGCSEQGNHSISRGGRVWAPRVGPVLAPEASNRCLSPHRDVLSSLLSSMYP